MIEDRNITAREAANLFGIDIAVIYRWHARRKLVASGMIPGPGRTGLVPLFRLSEVAHLAAERHQQHADRTH